MRSSAFLVMAVCVILVGIAWMPWLWLSQRTSHPPKFHAGECFAPTGLREPWDIEPTGRIILHGYTKYLVLYKSEADRVSGGTKSGWEESITEFDTKYLVVPCPEHWLTHTH